MDAQLESKKDASGKVTQVTLHQGGRDMLRERNDAGKPSHSVIERGMKSFPLGSGSNAKQMFHPLSPLRFAKHTHDQIFGATGLKTSTPEVFRVSAMGAELVASCQMPESGASILIGEDDGIIALDIQEQLRGLGYCVNIRAGTPREVVYLARETKPDLLVLDMNIKGDMRGLEVAREIHEIANIPIVFVSAYGADVVENDEVIPRPYRYVTKPFVFSELHAAIEDLLAGRRP